MSDERLRYLKGVKRKGDEKPKGPDHRDPRSSSSKSSSSKVEVEPKNERARFLAMVARRSSASRSRGHVGSGQVVVSEMKDHKVSSEINFTLSSLKEFAARNALVGSSGEAGGFATGRRRPNYDNRLRRLNMKFNPRVPHLVNLVLMLHLKVHRFQMILWLLFIFVCFGDLRSNSCVQNRT